MARERIARFTVSIPARLLQQLDEWCRRKGFLTRSHAVADLIRRQLVEQQWISGESELAGTITLVYDHHSQVHEQLTEVQHTHLKEIICTTHVHLDHENCLEVVIVKGHPKQIEEIANRLLTAKGVKHGKLTVTTTGLNLPA